VEGRYLWDTGCRHTLTTIPLDNLPFADNHAGHYIRNGIIINGHRLRTTSIITSIHFDKKMETIAREEGCDGVLGYYVFNGYWCELSFTESKIILHKKKPDKFSTSASGYVTSWGHPCITVNINETIPITFVVDTGAPYGFYFHQRLMAYVNPTEYKERFSINRRFPTSYQIPIKSMRVLEDIFVDKIIETNSVSSGADGEIGIEYLQYYDFLFDIRNNFSIAGNYRLWELYYIPRFPDLDKNTLQFYGIKNAFM
jgi:hypothetical protein